MRDLDALRKLNKAMLWLDLAVGCLLMWGAVTGYDQGWRKLASSLGGLICATLAALLGRAELRMFWARHYPVEEFIETMVNNRLALPVSGGVPGPGSMPLLDLPAILREALVTGSTVTASGDPRFLADLLVQMIGCTAAFLAGLGLWWGFFKLCGFALARERNGSLSKPARWGGALIGLIRQCCCGVLLIGAATPVAWLCGIPPEMLRLEKTFLARLAWHLFNRLGIWL